MSVSHKICAGATPHCLDLLHGPAGVLKDRSRWPDHLCYGPFLRESTARWSKSLSLFSWSLHGRAGECFVVHRWSGLFPLPVGKVALLREEARLTRTRSGAAESADTFMELLKLMPFEEDEEALCALRVQNGGSTLDLFGLAAYPTTEHREYGLALNGPLAFALRGRDPSLIDLVHAAKRWWSRFEGHPIVGRPANTGVWASADDFRDALEEALGSLREQGCKVTGPRLRHDMAANQELLARPAFNVRFLP